MGGHSLGGPVGPDGGPAPYALMGGPMMGHPRWSNHQQMSVPWSTGSVPMGRGLGTGMQSDMSWSVGQVQSPLRTVRRHHLGQIPLAQTSLVAPLSNHQFQWRQPQDHCQRMKSGYYHHLQ